LTNERFRIPLTRPPVISEMIDEIKDVIDSGFLTEGEKSREFERTIAKYCGVSHAIVVPNATIGLELALVAMRPMFGERNEIIVPGFTHPATILAILNAGLIPVVCDIDESTMLISIDSMSSGITNKTAGIMPVSLFGNPIDYNVLYDAIYDMNSGLFVIEDAACSLGSHDGDSRQRVGRHAHASVFSFHPRKIITLGEGGMVVTDNSHIIEQIQALKNFKNLVCGHNVFRVGSNYRISDIQAVMGVVQMRHIELIIKERRRIASIYGDLIDDLNDSTGNSNHVSRQEITENAYHNVQTYCVTVERDRNAIMNKMRKNGIEAQIGSYAISEDPMFLVNPNCRILSCPVTQHVASCALSLPVYENMTESEIIEVVEGLVL
jgi:perosamine synthetase